MKANELRIGNWVKLKSKNEYYQIWSGHDIEEIDSAPEFFDAIPIPITEEWLKRFGFQYSESKEWLILKYRVVTFDTDESVGFSIVYASVEGYKFGFAQTVHQLQNLYWCLTGEELRS